MAQINLGDSLLGKSPAFQAAVAQKIASSLGPTSLGQRLAANGTSFVGRLTGQAPTSPSSFPAPATPAAPVAAAPTSSFDPQSILDHGWASSEKGPNGSPGMEKKLAAGGWTPLRFAAALKLARRTEGGFDSGAYEKAIGGYQSAATEQEQSARHGTHGDIKFDNKIYGALQHDDNLAAAKDQRISNRQAGKSNREYNRTGQAIKKDYNDDSASNAAVASSGVGSRAVDTMGQTAKSNALASNATSRANNAATIRNLGTGLAGLGRRTALDDEANGADAVTSLHSNLSTTLASIKAALDTQVGGLSASEAQAQDAYKTSLRSAAQSLIAANNAANPALPANREAALTAKDTIQKDEIDISNQRNAAWNAANPTQPPRPIVSTSSSSSSTTGAAAGITPTAFLSYLREAASPNISAQEKAYLQSIILAYVNAHPQATTASK